MFIISRKKEKVEERRDYWEREREREEFDLASHSSFFLFPFASAAAAAAAAAAIQKYKIQILLYIIIIIIIHTLFSSLSLSNSNNGLCWILTGQTRRSALSLSLSLPTDLISFFPFQHFTFLPTNSLQGKPKTKFVFGCCSLSKIFDFVYNYLFIYFIFPDSYISLTCELLGSVHFFCVYLFLNSVADCDCDCDCELKLYVICICFKILETQ